MPEPERRWREHACPETVQAPVYTIDCREITCFSDFVDAFNQGFANQIGGHWNENFNAFHDLLWWPEAEYYVLEIQGAETCRAVLNDQATQDWADRNAPRWRMYQGVAKEVDIRQSFFLFVLWIIQDNPYIRLVLY